MNARDEFDLQTLSQRSTVMLLCGAALVGGSLAPWATVRLGALSLRGAGIHGDGRYTLALGGVLFVMGALSWWDDADYGLLGALVAAAAGGVGIYDAVRIHDQASVLTARVNSASATIEWGLYLVIGAAAAALLGLYLTGTSGASTSRSAPSLRADIPTPAPTNTTSAVVDAKAQALIDSARGSGFGSKADRRVGGPLVASCPFCGEVIPASVVTCPNCRQLVALVGLLRGTPEGWKHDPSQRFSERYWDGSRWTQRVRGGTDETSEDAPFVTREG